jgi:hypothetical protein
MKCRLPASGNRETSLVVLLAILFVATAAAQTSRVSEKEALPVLQKCFQCHGETLQMSKLDLHTRDGMLKGGENGPALVPGDANASLLYKRVAGLQQPIMPMRPIPPLTPAEIAILKDWINQGAQWDSGDQTKPLQVASPSVYGDYREKQITDQDRQWWAFQQPVRYPAPTVSDARWSRNPIDAFVWAMQKKKGLEAAPEADRPTLIRRAYLDLEGLLPTPAEVDAFVKDPAPDGYQKLIDRLLASPHYGERWGRFWLDVVRYADSSGFEFDIDITNAWRYRDYVIKAFNTDKPYDQFVIEQLAGDELDHPTEDSLIGTTYYREGPRVRFREKNYPSYRYDYMDDMIRTTFQGFMGLSVNCARCHDHKFDPITRLDYYKSVAMFWGYVDYDQPLGSKEQVQEYERIRKEVESQTAPLHQQIAQIEKPYKEKQRERLVQDALKKFPEDIQIAIKTPVDQRTQGQKLLVAQVLIGADEADPDAAAAADLDAKAKSKLQAKANEVFGASPSGLRYRGFLKLSEADQAKKAALLAKIEEIEKRVPRLPVADGVRDGDYRLAPDGLGDSNIPGTGRPTYNVKCCYIPVAGQKYEVPPLYFAANGGDIKADEQTFLVQPGFLKVLAKGNERTTHPPNRPDYVSSGRRRALAEWIASKDNPLTARVMVNRIWGWHFGAGIVATPGNFGKMGMAPSNPELLDWLATEFVRQGWSIKQMQRLIMTSETYRMASNFYRPANAEKDPTNVYLSAYPIHRLEAEIVRDVTLSASGQLNLEAGGEAFYPSLPRAVRAAQPRGRWELTEEGPDTWKRSVYAQRKRGLKYPMFEVYDEPDLNVTCERRSVSTVPTQALTMLNNEFMLLQADHFADRVMKEADKAPDAQVKLMYRIALSRDPSPKELSSNLVFLTKRREYKAAQKPGASDETVNLAAMTDLAHVVLNLNEFLYIR